jgi:hypothetical protein
MGGPRRRHGHLCVTNQATSCLQVACDKDHSSEKAEKVEGGHGHSHGGVACDKEHGEKAEHGHSHGAKQAKHGHGHGDKAEVSG